MKTIYTLTPITKRAREWLNGNLGGESTWIDDQLVIESRYVSDLFAGMVAAGLKPTIDFEIT